MFGIEHLMRSFTNLVWKPFDGVEPHCSMTFLEIFSSKKFSRVVVYCSVIKVPVVLFLRQLWYFIKSVPLCQELFYFSLFFAVPHESALIYYHFQSLYVNCFLQFFQLISQFSLCNYIWWFCMISSTIQLAFHKTYFSFLPETGTPVLKRKRKTTGLLPAVSG